MANLLINTGAVPCNLVITNEQVALTLADAIAMIKETDPTISDPLAKSKAQNMVDEDTKIKTVLLPIFPDNATLEMKPQDQIVYRVSTSREYLAYYQAVTSIDPTRTKFTIGEEVVEEVVTP